MSLHLETGSAYPPLAPGTLRLYSMKYCPFAQRTRLVLAHKNIQHEVININLKLKPEWLFEKNPLGLVPVLEKDGRIVYESDICDDYLDEIYPENKLTPEDPYERAQMKMLMERSSKVIPLVLGIIFRDNDLKEIAEKLHQALAPFENVLKGKFLGGNQLTMLDLHLWPALEKIDFMNEQLTFDFLPQDRFPKLSAWVSKMKNTPAAQNGGTDFKYYADIVSSYKAGTVPNYNIGMQQ